MSGAFRRWIARSGDEYRAQSEAQVRLRDQILAAMIGALALFLAFWVAAIDGEYGPECARTSISHYYYEPVAGTFFVIALTFVGAFMMAYRGRNLAENVAATAGGVAALLVAYFPTNGLGCAPETLADFRVAVEIAVPDVFAGGAKPETFALPATTAAIGTEATQAWHFRAAAVLFGVLLAFSAVFFPWVDRDRDIHPDTGRVRLVKQLRRFVIYWPMSAVMAVGLAMIVAPESGLAQAVSGAMAEFLAGRGQVPEETATVIRPVFHGEMLALMGFGISWLVKGRILLGWLDRYEWP